jgi:ketosteroid isomerase-like protein
MTATESVRTTDEAVLRELNRGYVDAFMNADAAWYDAHLADDFICVRADGSMLDKPAFLAGTTPAAAAAEYLLDDVAVRIHGPSAYVTALGTWRRQDGSTGQTRYIDSYVRTDDGWRVVSAQLTRVGAP